MLRRVALVSLIVTLGWSGSPEAKTLYAWVQLGPDGASARAVTDDATCPALVVDGALLAMAPRSSPSRMIAKVPPASAGFPVTACQQTVPGGAVAATLDGQVLPLPRPNPGRVLVLGDTGCRLKDGDPVQDCNDGEVWPFPRLAAAAAASRPDLVIHVGDYHYRESPCPADRRGCEGSPWGYGWSAWDADFFKPASPLLQAAPWVMTRGNHEDCARAGEGWWRLLDQAPMPESCTDLAGFFVATLGGFGVIIMDGANAPDPKGDPAGLQSKLAHQFSAGVRDLPAETWLATHRPLNAGRGDKGGLTVENRVQQAALGPLMPDPVSLIVSGHIHFFQAIDFGPTRPAQLVAGTGGDNLEPMVPRPVEGEVINGLKTLHATTRSGFGYMIFDLVQPGVWSGVVFDDRGRPIERCRLERRSLVCGQ